MVLKLKSALQSPRLILALKSVFFGGFFLLAYIGNFKILPVLFFLVISLLLYLKPLFNTFKFFIPFLVLLILMISLSGFLIKLSPLIIVLAAIFFSLLFYLILGLKNLAFVHRWQWYSLLNFLLFYILFLAFFLVEGKLFIFSSLGVIVVSFLLLREYIKFGASNFSKRRIIVSWALTLMVLEIVWAINLLPMGFLNSANLALLIVVVLSNLTINHFRGTLTKNVIMTNAISASLIALLIFITSKWSI